jgi:hypothetical protein
MTLFTVRYYWSGEFNTIFHWIFECSNIQSALFFENSENQLSNEITGILNKSPLAKFSLTKTN